MQNKSIRYAHTVLTALIATAGALGIAGCNSTGQPITAAPHFTLAFRGTDGGVHVRWSADGQTWQNPGSFPGTPQLAQGPGLGGIPSGLSQLLVFNRGTNLFRLSAIGASEYGSSPEERIQGGVTVDSALSVAFTGSGNWLIAHNTGTSGVLRLWDGTSNPTNVVTPPGALGNQCTSGSGGAIGPKLLQLNSRILVAFCQEDSSGNQSLQLLPGTLSTTGQPTFSAQLPFTATRSGFLAPHGKFFALAHDGTNFLLATIAQVTPSTGPLQTFGLMIHSSPDGQNWSFVTLTSPTSGILQSARTTHLGMAAIPPRSGNPALIQVAQYAGNNQSPRLWEFNGTAWTDRSGTNPFGAAAPDVSSAFSFRVNGM